MRGSILCEPSLPLLLISTTPVVATIDQDKAIEEDTELVMEDPTTIRKTASIPTASPRWIILRSTTTNPCLATNATGRPRKMIPATTAVNLATNPQVAQSEEVLRLPMSKLNIQEPLVVVQTSPQLAKKPATA
jgi:hypothetical protein